MSTSTISAPQKQKRTFYIKTFWCQMNYADSEKIHRVLLQAGCLKVIDPTQADIIILNTCSVRQKGEDKVFGFIREIRRFESNRSPLIGVTGCMTRKTGMAKRYLPEGTPRKNTKTISLWESNDSCMNWDDELLLRSEDIDFVFRIEETGYLTKILSWIRKEDFGNDEKWEEYLKIEQIPSHTSSVNSIIQTGCDNFCTFCIVPYTRGREFSRAPEEIITEIQKAVASGAKEVTLLWQNVNSYGKLTRAKLWNAESLQWKNDTPIVTPFRELLDELGKIEGLDRVRFTSSNPHDMTPDILRAHFEIPNLCHFLHFALQSGSDSVLKRMNRKHTYADFKAQVEYLRSQDPLFGISTDIIVGFPGETEEEFQMTETAMRECEFDFAYIARYNTRNGTRAAEFPDMVSPEEKARRWDILNQILRESIVTRSQKMIGRVEEILITGTGRTGNWVGRTRNFKEVYIESSLNLLDSIVPIRITELDDLVLKGELL